MAYTSKHDGKRFEDHARGKFYDSVKGSEKTKGPKMGEEPDSGGKSEGSDEQNEQPIEQSVQEHGPVTHMEVSSHHQDGHVHKSTHHDPMSAHHHVDTAMPQQPEPEGGNMGAGGIPTMKHMQGVV